MVRLRRLFLENPGAVKPVGEGISEMRVDDGHGDPRLGTLLEVLKALGLKLRIERAPARPPSA